MIEGWEREKLGSVCNFVRGPFGGSLKKSCFVNEGYAVYEQQHAIYNQFDEIRYFVDEAKFNEMSRFELRTGDLIMSCSGTMGKVAIVPEDIPQGIINQALLKLTVNERLDVSFLQLWMQSPNFQMQLIKHSKGAAIKNVASVKVLKEIELDLPILPEQKRIVAILDEAFTGISKAVANAEKNLANARELFESYLNNVITQKGDGWYENRLSDFTKSVSTGPFGSLLHKSDYVTKGVPLVNPINIVDGVIVPNESKLIDKSTKERLGAYVLSEGDIVIGRRGEIGRCAVVGKKQDGWICGTGCFFVKPLSDVNSDFLAHLLRSNEYREKLESVATGATMKNISNKSLSNLIVRIPSLESQISILKQISGLKQQTLKLETVYQQKLAALTELKQSILQKAFTGELAADALLQQANG